MKHYLLLPKVFLCFVALGVLSGCVEIAAEIAGGIYESNREIDTRGAWGVKTSKNTGDPVLPISRIRPGKSSKQDVLGMLRTPIDKTSDDRFFLYRYELQIYKVREKGGVVLERTPGPLRHARLLIWFDQTDTVKRYRWHECKPTAASSRKCHSSNQLCEMIKGLKDEQLIAHYC